MYRQLKRQKEYQQEVIKICLLFLLRLNLTFSLSNSMWFGRRPPLPRNCARSSTIPRLCLLLPMMLVFLRPILLSVNTSMRCRRRRILSPWYRVTISLVAAAEQQLEQEGRRRRQRRRLLWTCNNNSTVVQCRLPVLLTPLWMCSIGSETMPFCDEARIRQRRRRRLRRLRLVGPRPIYRT